MGSGRGPFRPWVGQSPLELDALVELVALAPVEDESLLLDDEPVSDPDPLLLDEPFDLAFPARLSVL